MTGWLIIFAAGFAGSFHCVGMCGGFACGLGPDPGGSRSRTVVRHLSYNIGRMVTYMFIGALAGLLGAAMVGHGAGQHMAPAGHTVGFILSGELGWVQRALSAVAGGLMVIMALQLLGMIRHASGTWLIGDGGFFVSAAKAVLRSRHPAAPVVMGVINGFLPCPLVFAFAAMAAATGSAVSGIATMAALGLGTFPAMLFMGSVGRMLAPTMRRGGVRLAGCFVLLIGVVTVVRGIAPTLLHLGGHGT